MITEDGRIEFNEQEQEAVNKIVGDRLARESIHDKNEIIETLKEFGYEGTAAEIKAAVKQQAIEFKEAQAQAAREQELEDLQYQAKMTGTTPEMLAEIKELKAELSEIKGEREATKNAANQRIEETKTINAQLAYFAENEDTKNVDIVALNENAEFVEFLDDLRKSTEPDFLVKAYKKFIKYRGGAEEQAMAKIKSNLARSTSSGRAKGDSSGGTYGLSESQVATCEEWNRKNPQMKMTYKEYSERI